MRSILLALVVLLALPALGQAPDTFRTSFEDGAAAAEGWSLSGGQGSWEKEGRTGRRCLALTGTGKDAQFWKSDTWTPRPSQLYRLTFWAKSPGASGGCLVSGPSIVNHDFSLSSAWQRYSTVFITPRATQGAYLRLGHWNVTGKTLFDDVRVTPVVALHGGPDGSGLGEGEQIENGTYRFAAPLTGGGSNSSRPLAEHTAGYNTNRWVMGGEAYVVYRHRVGTHRQRSASVEVSIGYYVRGRLAVEASRDGKTWQPAGTLAAKEEKRFDIPAALLPADEVWVRLRGEGDQRSREDSSPGEFQVHGYTYEAGLDGTPKDAIGQTTFLEVERNSGPARVAVQALGSLRPGGTQAAELRVANPGAAALPVQATLTFTDERGKQSAFRSAASVPARGEAPLRIPYSIGGTGNWIASLSLTAAKQPLYAATTEFEVPALFAADYGYLVAQDAAGAVWWAEGTHKISRERPAPAAKQPVVTLSAARHEYEPVQVVLRPSRALTGVTAQVEDFVGPKGARIARANTTLRLVHYVRVTRPTDKTGVAGDWPDPLPPYEGPFNVPAGVNQPIWLTLYVPADAAPGDYTSRLRLRAGAWSQEVPIRLHVWGFTLPKETHIRSAFGFSPGSLRRYHNLETNEELVQVTDLYHRNFSEHRISPYDPTPFAPIQVTFGEGAWHGGRQVADQPFEGARCLQLVDNDEKANVSAEPDGTLPVDPMKEYRLTWAARTATDGQPYLVTVQHYDAAGQWLSGRNTDLRVNGSKAWRREEASLRGRIPEQARSARLVLRAAPWSDDGKATGTTWFDAVSLRQAPDGPELVKDGGFETTLDLTRVKVDFTQFDKAASRAFDELHFNSFRLPVAGMGGGTFHSRHAGRIGSYDQGTPEYEALFTAYLRQVQDHLEAKGWLDEAYVYWFDEPEPRDYDFVKDGMALLKRAAPKLTRMLTEQVEPQLTGYVDLWCPVTSSYGAESAQARQKAGERIWWYVCTGPKEPYCTLFIDHPGVEMRTWLWQTWKYGVEGILVWTSNYWTSGAAFPPPAIQNPWSDPMSYVSGYDYQPGQKAYWGNGDGRFIYPPNRDPENDKKKHLTGPVDSFRWEMLREGLEDTEYFYALRDAIAKAKARGVPAARLAAAEKLLEVPAAVTTDMTHFSTSPLPMYAHREKLARAIEGLAGAR